MRARIQVSEKGTAMQRVQDLWMENRTRVKQATTLAVGLLVLGAFIFALHMSVAIR